MSHWGYKGQRGGSSEYHMPDGLNHDDLRIAVVVGWEDE